MCSNFFQKFLILCIALSPFNFIYSIVEDEKLVGIAIQAVKNELGQEWIRLFENKLEFINQHSLEKECEDSFHIVDIGVLVDRFVLWKSHLPTINPYYAIKTNNDKIVASVLGALGTGFDCASQQEIEQALSVGASPSTIIFAHPRKTIASLLHAKSKGIDLLTFDSLEELDKILIHYPEARLLLRIKTEDSHSSSMLSQKFGATMEEARAILEAGFNKKAQIVGIAFHVGSNCTHWDSYRQALVDAAELFNHSKTRCDQILSLLDLGGGWPGTDDESFIRIANLINQLIPELFDANVSLMAEPGRYFAAKTTTLATRILGKKKLSIENKIQYYLSNGVFGFFTSSLYYDYNAERILSEGWIFKPLKDPKVSVLYPTLLWGPTCDSGDKIIDGILLPEMETNDFLIIENMGAYTNTLQTSFNGIPLSQPYYLIESKKF